MAERIGIDYESNPEGFLAATRQVKAGAAEALAQFDLTNASLKRLAVAYLNTGDSAKQGAILGRMASIEAVENASMQVTSQREVQAAVTETASVVERSARRQSTIMQLLQSVFRADTKRGLRSELSGATEDVAASGGSLAALGKTAGVLAGSLAITAAASPLISRAFTAMQGPAEALDKALFGDIDRFNQFKKATEDSAAALLKAKGAFGAADQARSLSEVVTQTSLLNAELSNAQQHMANVVSTYKGIGDITAARQAAEQVKELTKAAAASDEQQKQLTTDLESLRVKLGDSGGAANGYAKELDLVHSMGLSVADLNESVTSTLANIGRGMDDAAASAARLAAAGAAAQASIAALIALDSNLPAPLASARTHAAGASAASSIAAALGQAGGVAGLRAQGASYNAADLAALQRKGGGGYTAANAARDTFADSQTRLASRISTEGQTTPTSIAYAEQLKKQEQKTLSLAEAGKKHAAALVKAATGEKARHAATLTLARAQSEVNAATRNLVKLQNDETTIRRQAAKTALELKDAKLEAFSNMADASVAATVKVTEAKAALDLEKKGTLGYYQELTAYNAAVASQQAQAKQAALDLANAKIEAGINYADPLSAANAAVKEAQNRVAGDQQGTTQFYLDTAAVNQALYNLSQVTAQNTAATQQNTSVLTGVLPGGKLPDYLALRAGANSGAFLTRNTGGSANAPIVVQLVVDGKTFAQTIEPDMTSAQAARARRNAA